MRDDINSDLETAIRDALDEAGAKIIAAIEEQQRAFLESLQETIETFDGNGSRTGRSRKKKNSNGRRRKQKKRPPKSEWVSTDEVIDTLRAVLDEYPEGLRIGELRAMTEYTDMQLHRGLKRLEEGAEIVKEGEVRKTLYRPARRRRRPR